MPRQTLSERVDLLTAAMARIERSFEILEKEVDWQLSQLERSQRQAEEYRDHLSRIDQRLSLIEQQMMELRSNEARRGERRHTFQHDLFLALVNAILAAMIAYFVAKS